MHAPLLALALTQSATTPAPTTRSDPAVPLESATTSLEPASSATPAPEPASSASSPTSSAPASSATAAPEPAGSASSPTSSEPASSATTPAPGTPAAPAPTPSTPVAPAPEPAPARSRIWGPEPRPKFSGYGGPAVRLSSLHGAFAALVGLEGGVNIMQRLTLGASFLWLLNPVDARQFSIGPASRINLNYGGLVLDVAYARSKRVAGTLGGLLGGGGACVQDPDDGTCADKTAFFVGEPRTGLRIILAPETPQNPPIVRLHLAFGWRLVAAQAWQGPRALGGPSGSITLEFGWF